MEDKPTIEEKKVSVVMYCSKEQKQELKQYAKKNGKTSSALLWESYNSFRDDVGEHPVMFDKITLIVKKYFKIPFNLPVDKFISFLYMLSVRYPNARSNTFWTKSYYVHADTLSNKEIYELLQKDLKENL